MALMALTPANATRIVRGFDLALAHMILENMEGKLAPQDVRDNLIDIIGYARKELEMHAGVKIDPLASLNPQFRPAAEVAEDLIDSLDE